jgi:tetratricopeptide (TPR) repeat protein
MTDRDVLRRASEALRDATEPSPEELARLRARVLSRGKVAPLRKSTNDSKRRLRWILPLAAAFIAGSALAATPGAFDGMLSAVERYLDIELFGHAHETAQKPAARPAADTAKSSAIETISPLASVTAEPDLVPSYSPEPAFEPPAVPSPSHASSERPRTTRPRAQETPMQVSAEANAEAGKAETSEAPTAQGPSRDLALYNKAHALHFRERRYNEALFAWEEYLGLTPTPTFALEARYNRALCLLRLAHYEEARAALVPFAEGRYLNGYRRDEATRFIQALDKRR